MNNFNAILAAIANLQVKRGDKVTLVFTFSNPNQLDSEGNPQPYPLNTYDSINIGCKRWPSDSVYLWRILDLQYTGDQDQQLVIPLTATETDFPEAKYHYDIEGVTGLDKETIAEGLYIPKQDVQR